MPITIETRYIGPTDTLPARIKVSANGRPFRMTFNFAYDGDEHRAAVRAFRDEFFPGRPLMHCGETRDQRGDVYCINAVQVEEAQS